MQYLFTDLVVLSELQHFLTSFHSGSGVAVEILNVDNQVISSSAVGNIRDHSIQIISQSHHNVEEINKLANNAIPTTTSTIFQMSRPRAILKKG